MAETQTPRSYYVDRVELINHEGKVADIKDLVKSFVVFESLLSSTLICDLHVLDRSNFFEDYELCGQESFRIRVEVNQNIRGETTRAVIDHEFFVTEYPGYTRSFNEYTQEYIIRGVSEFAYISPLKKISKAFNNSPVSIIEDILKTDLNVPRISKRGNAASFIRGVIPIQSPLAAVEWIKTKAYDELNSPFFVYQTTDGYVNIDSLYSLIQQEPYSNYFYKKSNFTRPGIDDYELIEKMKTIQKIDSKLNLSKSYQQTEGAFSSREKTIDIGNRAFRESVFDYLKAPHPTLNGNSNMKDRELRVNRDTEKPKAFNNIPDASLSYRLVSSNAYSGDIDSSLVDEERARYANSWLSNYDTVIHSIELPGDINLNPGKVIELELPKGIAPELYEDYTGDDTQDLIDRRMSGKYLVFRATHKFFGGVYDMEAEIRKDSI